MSEDAPAVDTVHVHDVPAFCDGDCAAYVGAPGEEGGVGGSCYGLWGG